MGFFLLIGMSGLPGHEAFILAVVALALLPLKGALFYGLLVGFKLRARSGVLAGLALANYSEFGLIVVQAAAARGLLPESWVVALALTVALSFAVSAPLNRASHAIYTRLSPLVSRLERRQRHPDDEPISIGAADVMIFGMGRVGLGAYERLKARGMRVVGLDSDPGDGRAASRRGEARGVRRRRGPGSVAPPAPGRGLSAVLLAVPDLEAKRFAIHEIRRAGIPGTPERDQRLPRGGRRSPRLRVHHHLQLLRAGRRGVRGGSLDGVGEGGREGGGSGTGDVNASGRVERRAAFSNSVRALPKAAQVGENFRPRSSDLRMFRQPAKAAAQCLQVGSTQGDDDPARIRPRQVGGNRSQHRDRRCAHHGHNHAALKFS